VTLVFSTFPSFQLVSDIEDFSLNWPIMQPVGVRSHLFEVPRFHSVNSYCFAHLFKMYKQDSDINRTEDRCKRQTTLPRKKEQTADWCSNLSDIYSEQLTYGVQLRSSIWAWQKVMAANCGVYMTNVICRPSASECTDLKNHGVRLATESR